MNINKLLYFFLILLKSPNSIIVLLYKYIQKFYIIFFSKLRKDKYCCNICENKYYKFISDNWHKNIICPNCFSEIRHRLFFLALKQKKFNLDYNKNNNKIIYHFAPENYLINFFKNLSSEYKTVDLYRKEYDINLDISNMKEIKNNSIDYIIAIDVLEHVENFKECLKEIKRVLTLEGEAIISVPQIDGLEKTIFFDHNLSSNHRKAKYGQIDHSNLFGKDLKDIFFQSGFKVKTISSNSFQSEEVKKYVLKPYKNSDKKFATNDRRIYSLTN